MSESLGPVQVSEGGCTNARIEAIPHNGGRALRFGLWPGDRRQLRRDSQGLDIGHSRDYTSTKATEGAFLSLTHHSLSILWNSRDGHPMKKTFNEPVMDTDIISRPDGSLWYQNNLAKVPKEVPMENESVIASEAPTVSQETDDAGEEKEA
jgi:hypothetical protein